MVFLFGFSDDYNEALKLEGKTHMDIIQEDFSESYWNLTHKTIMGLKWAVNQCPKAKFIFKTDDDVMVYPETLKEHLKTVLNSTYVGGSWQDTTVPRGGGKWSVDKCEYPPESYPLFCNGAGYIFSRKAAKMTYEATVNVPFYRMEDVYITGLVANEYLGILLQNIPTLPHSHG